MWGFDPADLRPGDLSSVFDTTGIADGETFVWDSTLSVLVAGAPPGGTAVVETIVPGPGIDVDSSDPANPIVSKEALTGSDIMDLGRWEVVVSAVPAEAVTNEAGDDWLYTWVGA